MSGAAWPVSSDYGVIPTLYMQQSVSILYALKKAGDGVLMWCEQATDLVPFNVRGSMFDLSDFGSGLALNGEPNGEPVYKVFERVSLYLFHNTERTRHSVLMIMRTFSRAALAKIALRRTSVRMLYPHRIDSLDFRVTNVRLEPNYK